MRLLFKRLSCTFILLALIIDQSEQRTKAKRKKSHIKSAPRERNIKSVPHERSTTSKNAILEGMGKEQLVPARVSQLEQKARLKRKQIHRKNQRGPHQKMGPQQPVPAKVKEMMLTDTFRFSF